LAALEETKNKTITDLNEKLKAAHNNPKVKELEKTDKTLKERVRDLEQRLRVAEREIVQFKIKK